MPVQKSSAPDLSTRIHEDIDSGQYECVICTNEVDRTSQIWSCSICWTVTHLQCVNKWHSNEPKYEGIKPRWRCPGCNSAISSDPGPNACWCGKEINPKSIPGLPGHSCGQTCWRAKDRCPHPCSIPCHAGPCPPCSFMVTQTCFCGKTTSPSRRCTDTDYSGWSCQTVCDDLLPCGRHTCPRTCHEGLCGSCETLVLSNCYCGKTQTEIPCDQIDEFLESFNYGQHVAREPDDPSETDGSAWFEGSHRCEATCGRLFDCSHHRCERSCHLQDELPAHCPFAPDTVTHCPCGRTPLADLPDAPRVSCEDEIPRCALPCGRERSCGHICPRTCHTGSCESEPCVEKVNIPCRCSYTPTEAECHVGIKSGQSECSRVCRAQLNCGKHICGRICCAGERKAADRQTAKRRKAPRHQRPRRSLRKSISALKYAGALLRVEVMAVRCSATAGPASVVRRRYSMRSPAPAD